MYRHGSFSDMDRAMRRVRDAASAGRARGCGAGAGSIFVGLVLVTLGVFFLLGNMGYFPARDVFRTFWPLILICFGVSGLIGSQGNPASRGGAVLWLAFGTFFLLSNLRVIDLPFGVFWPSVLIVIGSMIMWRTLGGSRYNREPDRGNRPGPRAGGESTTGSPLDSGAMPRTDATGNGSTENSTFSAVAILGGVERRCNSQQFRGADLSVFIGGCEVDLRGASPAEGRAVIDVFSLIGGIEIWVPPDWTVVSEVTPIVGGYEDKTQPPKDNSKVLVIRGVSIIGGIEVKN